MIDAGSALAVEYLAEHDRLLDWAAYNRAILGEAFCRLLGCAGRMVLDNVHNSIRAAAPVLWLHRKGAAEARSGEVVLITGSRGGHSAIFLRRKRMWSRTSSRWRTEPDASGHGREHAPECGRSMRWMLSSEPGWALA